MRRAQKFLKICCTPAVRRLLYSEKSHPTTPERPWVFVVIVVVVVVVFANATFKFCTLAVGSNCRFIGLASAFLLAFSQASQFSVFVFLGRCR